MNKINDNVLRSAYASKLTYVHKHCKNKTKFYHKQLIGSNVKTLKLLYSDATGTEACVWKSGVRSFIVSFKGSSTCQDISNFFDCKMIDFSFCDKKCRIHAGIYNMFSSIEPSLTNCMNIYDTEPPLHITFCGHSLGGSIAAFAAAYIGHISNKKINITCHTFGAPRTGDADFVKWFDDGVENSLHVVHNSDVIPLLPLAYAQNSSIYTLYEKRKNIDMGDIIRSHDMDTYIDLLQKKTKLK